MRSSLSEQRSPKPRASPPSSSRGHSLDLAPGSQTGRLQFFSRSPLRGEPAPAARRPDPRRDAAAVSAPPSLVLPLPGSCSSRPTLSARCASRYGAARGSQSSAAGPGGAASSARRAHRSPRARTAEQPRGRHPHPGSQKPRPRPRPDTPPTTPTSAGLDPPSWHDWPRLLGSPRADWSVRGSVRSRAAVAAAAAETQGTGPEGSERPGAPHTHCGGDGAERSGAGRPGPEQRSREPPARSAAIRPLSPAARRREPRI